MRSRLIDIRNLSPSDEEAWRRLAARSVEPNPFYEVDFLVPACHYLKNGNRAALLVAEEAGHFHACLPVRRVKVLGVVSPPVITSWRHLYGYLGTPLVAPERSVEALSSVLAGLRGTGAFPRLMVFELFGDDGPVAAALRSAAAELGLTVQVHASGERAVFRCQDEKADALPATIKKARRARARQWRRLCDDYGDTAVVDRAGDPDGSTDFLAMEAAGWKGKAGTAMMSRPGDAAFYREVTVRFGVSGRLYLHALEAGGKTLAIQSDLRAGHMLFGWKIAYDERFGSYSPGVQLQLRVFDLASKDDLHGVDTCSDVGNDHQSRLFPDRRRIATLVISGNGRLTNPGLTLAVRAVEFGGKLRGLSGRTLRYRAVTTSRRIGRIFRR